MQTNTSRTNVNVRGGGFAGDRACEGIEGNFARLEITAQPDSLGSVGTYSHIAAAAMIEAQRAMQVGFTFGADREGMLELLLEGLGKGFQVSRFPEQTVAFVMLHAGGEGIAK